MAEKIRREKLVQVVQKYPWDTFIHTNESLIVGDSRVGGTVDFFNDSADKLADYLFACYALNARIDVALHTAWCKLQNTLFRDNWQDNAWSLVEQAVREFFSTQQKHLRQLNKTIVEIAKHIMPFVSPIHPLRQLFV